MALLGNLSSELLMLLVGRLLESVSELAYALELRLVCKDFNDAILHQIFSTDKFSLEIDQWPSSRCEYPFAPCADVLKYSQLWARIDTVNLKWTKRHFVRGRMKTSTSTNHQRRSLWQHLREAACYLDVLSRENAQICRDLRDALSPLGRCAEAEAIREAGTFAVCEAFLLFFNDDTILNDNNELRPPLIEEVDRHFWLYNVACWSGSSALLSHLDTKFIEESITTIGNMDPAMQCIPTAIRAGQREIVTQIVQRHPGAIFHENIHLVCPIEAALRVGDSNMVFEMLQLDSSLPLELRILSSLSKARPEPWACNGYIAAIDQLLPLATSLSQDDQSGLTINIVKAGKAAGVKILLKHGHLNSYQLRITAGRSSALDFPSRTGDVSSVRELLLSGYLDQCKASAIDKVLTRAAISALSWNHKEVFDELSKHSNQSIVPQCLPSLAAADGTLSLLRRCCGYEQLEHATAEITRDFCGLYTTDREAALEMAARALKHENVDFLLRLGIRFSSATDQREIRTSWSYARRHLPALSRTQRVLKRYGLSPIIVVV